MRTVPTDASEQTKRSIDLLWDEIDRLNRQLEESKNQSVAKSSDESESGITEIPNIRTTEGVQGNSLGTFDQDITLKMDINGLTEDTAPLIADDFLVTYDASASLHKKIKPTNLTFIRRLSTDTTPVAVTNGTLQNLMTYAVPAGLLASDGSYLHVVAAGTTAANANAKAVTINWGAYNITYVSGAVNNLDWVIEMWVYRVSATSQIVVGKGGWNGFMLYCQESTASETLANSITIKCTGDGVAASDITQTLLSVEYIP